MRLALHPATCGGDVDLMADYCRYMGVRDLFYQLHDVEGYRDGGFETPDAIMQLVEQFRAVGLKISAANDFLPNSPDELERRRGGLVSTVDLLARAGIETLILFDLQPQQDDLWESLRRLYTELVPRADAAGVKIATHSHWCEGHIAYNAATMKHIIEIAPEPANGICLCAGCSYQAGDSPAEIVRQMPERIHCVHIRDTSAVGGCDLEERPLGSGGVPIRETLAALMDVGYTGLVIPEHLSTVRAQANMEVTHAHAVGYLQGIMSALQGG
jgi:mannonate dehydratase